jgi:mRNA interferase MazF
MGAGDARRWGRGPGETLMAASAPAPGGMVVRRGDVWWVDFDLDSSDEMRPMRPAVVITADALNRARRTVIVVPLASGPQPRPPIVVATPSAGDNRVAVCDQARAVDKARLTRTAGQLSAADLKAVEDGLRRVLEL